MSFGSRLKNLRLQNKMTQQMLGDVIHVSKVSISGYENGNRFPDTSTLQQIADFFQVTTDYLLDRKVPTELLSEDFAKDIEVELKSLLKIVSEQDYPIFHGRPLDGHTKELITQSFKFDLLLLEKMTAKRR